MAQTSFGRRGRFWPTRRPLFHAAREEALLILISVDMVDLHVQPLPPQRRRSAGRTSYRNHTLRLRDPVPSTAGVGRKAVDGATEGLRHDRTFRTAGGVRSWRTAMVSDGGDRGSGHDELIAAASALKLRGGATAFRPRHPRTWCQRSLPSDHSFRDGCLRRRPGHEIARRRVGRADRAVDGLPIVHNSVEAVVSVEKLAGHLKNVALRN